MTSDELSVVRRAYAKQIAAAAGADDPRIEAAFATVLREDFLPSGPWPMFRMGRGFVPSPSADPVYLYTNDLVAIAPERHINNGQPSLHAHLLHQAAPQEGEHVVHVGAGAGYYTAIIATLVGVTGTVTAIEFQSDLAERARANLASFPNIKVVEGDGRTHPFALADVIYVNAGATRPSETWLDGLTDGGRLVLPLTTDLGFTKGNWERLDRKGAVFLITRRADGFDARWISPVGIFPCEGGRDESDERALSAALARGDARSVTRLRRSEAVPDELVWMRTPEFALTIE